MALQKTAVTGLLAEVGYHRHTRPALHVWYSWADHLVIEAAASASLVTVLRGWLSLLCRRCSCCSVAPVHL